MTTLKRTNHWRPTLPLFAQPYVAGEHAARVRTAELRYRAVISSYPEIVREFGSSSYGPLTSRR